MVAIGTATAVIASRYQIGTLTKMGPGFVPLALGVMLALLGVAIAAANFYAQVEGEEFSGPHGHGIAASSDRPEWRGWICIIGGVLAFIFSAEYVGLIAATFLSVFVASWGDRTATLKGGLTLALGITVFGILLFSDLLRVQLADYQTHLTAMIVSALLALLFVYHLVQLKWDWVDVVSAVCLLIASGFVAWCGLFIYYFIKQVPLATIPASIPFRGLLLLSGLLTMGHPLYREGFLKLPIIFWSFMKFIGAAVSAVFMFPYGTVSGLAEKILGQPAGKISTFNDLRYAVSVSVFGLIFFGWVLLLQLAARLGGLQ